MHSFSNRIRRLEYALGAALGISLILSVLLAAPVARQCSSIQDKVVRLHILANSDSDADQTQKLRVRDRILNETGTLLRETQSRAEAESLIESLLPEFERIAEEQLRADGCSDRVHAELTDMYFSARTYDGGTMPAGTYRALRLTIGKGEGRNWWCVVFPPMCVSAAVGTDVSGTDASGTDVSGTDVSGAETLDDVLTAGEMDIVSHPERYEVRLKIVEWWEWLRCRIRGE